MQDSETNERRRVPGQQIEHMLEERRQLLALLMQISNLETGKLDLHDEDLLEEFCQVLVDYVAAGHFGLYQRIVEGTERRQDLAATAKNIYPQIENTTHQALEFSEKYDAENGARDLSSLAGDLSGLGIALTARMELEDQLIARILG